MEIFLDKFQTISKERLSIDEQWFSQSPSLKHFVRTTTAKECRYLSHPGYKAYTDVIVRKNGQGVLKKLPINQPKYSEYFEHDFRNYNELENQDYDFYFSRFFDFTLFMLLHNINTSVDIEVIFDTEITILDKEWL